MPTLNRSLAAGAALLALAVGGAATAVAESPAKPRTAAIGGEAGAAFIKLDPLQIAVTPDGRRFYQVLLAVSLEVPQAENQAVVEKLMPRLRDAYIRELYGRPVNRDGRWGPQELELVKRRLLAQSDRVLGPGVVSNVLVQQALRFGG